VANLVAILAGIGLVVGGLSYTGVAGAFSRELLLYAGGSIPLMLAAGAVTSFVLGMGMTVSACYIFLSILLAPALVAARAQPAGQPPVHPLLGHDVLHHPTGGHRRNHRRWRGRGARAGQTGLYAMRLGSILFVLPFLFVLNPSLILQGDIGRILLSAFTAITAMWLLASAAEAYLYRVGIIRWQTRIPVLIAGLALIYPEPASDLAGFALIALIYAAHWMIGRRTLAERTP
jgi:TRAP-type uncharacterized transport system fused permease subunit